MKTNNIELQVDELQKRVTQVEMLVSSARTHLMMYKSTRDNKYLWQAKLDIKSAESIKAVGFIRSMGVLLVD